MTRTITALYDSRSEAEAARSQLTAAGIDASSVHIASQEGSSESSSASSGSASGSGSGGGFMQGLKDFFMPDEDRHAYGEGVRRGGYVLSASVPESQADEACRILDQTGAVDFDERQQQWRTSGWDGRMQSDETIPVVEEQLRVGKREVERGGVRVRSYVEETPVQEQIALREEHVDIERRPVDQPVRGAEADSLFQERSIELTERGEEAVVAKEAVVREEIGIRKDVDQRTETISDTVRHTEVEIDDTRGGRSFDQDRSRFDGGVSGQGLAGEPASFSNANDDADHSIAMDPEHGSRVEETEEERRRRLEHGRDGRPSSY